jgi:hypothetical protein
LSVGADASSVLNALDRNAIGAEAGLEAVGCGRTDDGTHVANFTRATSEDHDDIAAATISELGGTATHTTLAGLKRGCQSGGGESDNGEEEHDGGGG